jgi:hypothetical protein
MGGMRPGHPAVLGARGYYRPDLIIHHYVPPERLTKRYFRRWCFWRGVSQGVLDRRRPAPVPYVLGVPRYRVGAAVRATIDLGRALLGGRDPARTFQSELAWWDLAGLVYGKHFYSAGPSAAGSLARHAGAVARRWRSKTTRSLVQ